MFKIDVEDKTTIRCTRGDTGNIVVRKKRKDGSCEPFYAGDIVIFSIKENFGDSDAVLRKEKRVTEDTDSVTFNLTKKDTTIGDLIAAPTKYQYDISVNEDTTILGYDDETGAKFFILYPEGSNDE
ncbi:MAG: hypothetical protein HFE81_00795 [Bacilli bacterium]|nr:hypothetical protein [Bacilli bacterium]MCI8914924.1 hypothetical protein [Lawsonibacter sp.]